MDSERKQVYTRRISEANRAQLVTVVYDMAMEYMTEARTALREQELTQLADALRHARACLDDLLSALDMRYELSAGLSELYLYAKRELLKAEAKRDDGGIRNALLVVERLREAWVQIEPLDQSAPGFDNAQTVYAGLTYGRGTLNESVADPGANRGLTV